MFQKIVIILFLCCAVSCHHQTPFNTAVSAYDEKTDKLLHYVNAFRFNNGKADLTKDAIICSVAQRHADWMARAGKLSHKNDNGEEPWDRVEKVGKSFSAIGENIADESWYDPEAVITMWENSSGHRKNMLGDYSHIGIGVACGDNSMYYWCAVFVSQ
jgi:uncharacterized protein YkwD